jgi:hypothetical protein
MQVMSFAVPSPDLAAAPNDAIEKRLRAFGRVEARHCVEKGDRLWRRRVKEAFFRNMLLVGAASSEDEIWLSPIDRSKLYPGVNGKRQNATRAAALRRRRR